MITTSGIKIGQVVKSKAGRDKDEFFIVLEIVDQKYLLLVNGKTRTLKKPKKKKIIHVAITNEIAEINPNSKELNDSHIRKALAKFSKE